MRLSPDRLVTASLPSAPLPPAPVAPSTANRVEPAPPGAEPFEALEPGPVLPASELVAARRSAEAGATLARVLRQRPSLEASLPDSIPTPTARLLYVVAHRELSEGLGPLTVPIGATDSIRRLADGSLTLTSPGAPPLHLNDAHGDLARLLGGAEVWGALESTTLHELLATAVRSAYADPGFDGGGAAANERGGHAFTYATIQQVLASDDPSQRGLECLASAAVHLWKSSGLIPPWLTRKEFEHRYTTLHGARGATVRLGPEFERTLRGGRSAVRLDAAATADFANRLREDDWARLTGAANARYAVRPLKTIDDVVAHFERGGAGVRTTWADGGHYFVLTGARVEGGQVFVNEDDSLRHAAATRTGGSHEPYRRPYDPARHTRFWTLERTR